MLRGKEGVGIAAMRPRVHAVAIHQINALLIDSTCREDHLVDLAEDRSSSDRVNDVYCERKAGGIHILRQLALRHSCGHKHRAGAQVLDLEALVAQDLHGRQQLLLERTTKHESE